MGGEGVNHSRVVHTGRLTVGFAYCALIVGMPCGISFYIPYYCSLITTKVHSYGMSSAYLRSIFIGALPQINRYVDHFSEMKGDVGMSLREKEGNKKIRQEIIDNPSLHQ